MGDVVSLGRETLRGFRAATQNVPTSAVAAGGRQHWWIEWQYGSSFDRHCGEYRTDYPSYAAAAATAADLVATRGFPRLPDHTYPPVETIFIREGPLGFAVAVRPDDRQRTLDRDCATYSRAHAYAYELHGQHGWEVTDETDPAERVYYDPVSRIVFFGEESPSVLEDEPPYSPDDAA